MLLRHYSDDTTESPRRTPSVVAVSQQSPSADKLDATTQSHFSAQSPPRVRKIISPTASPARLPRSSSLLPPPAAVAAAATTAAAAETPVYFSREVPSFAALSPKAFLLPDSPPKGPDYNIDSAPGAFVSKQQLQLPLLPFPPTLPLSSPTRGRSPDLRVYSDAAAGDDQSKGREPPDKSGVLASPRRVLTMPYEMVRELVAPARSHSRSRSEKSSVDMAKPHSSKSPSQKAMLSRALQKANTAVQLDNSQNFESAKQAYYEACELLNQVLLKTSAEEDKRKLESIRSTYAGRIEELDQSALTRGDRKNKELPARPDSVEGRDDTSSRGEVVEVEIVNGTADISGEEIQSWRRKKQRQDPRFLSDGYQEIPRQSRLAAEQPSLHSTFSRSPQKIRSIEDYMTVGNRAPQQSSIIARRPVSPRKPQHERQDSEDRGIESHHSSSMSGSRDGTGHFRNSSQNSWLDPIDESAGSTNTSIHSRTSSAFRPKHFRGPSGNTEAEFDTALDAAIEAAYNEGYEPMELQEHDKDASDRTEDLVNKALRKVEEARERVRQTEREAYPNKLQQRAAERRNQQDAGAFYDDNLSSDEEERILEEMTRDYQFDDFVMHDKGSDSQPPELHQRATRPGANAVGTGSAPDARPLTATADRSDISQQHSASRGLHPSAPPPKQSLPDPPPARGPTPDQTVRSRRLSGQNPKQLKIHTTQAKEPPVVVLQDVASTTRVVNAGKEDQVSEITVVERPQTSRSTRRPSSPTVEILDSEVAFVGSPPFRRGQVDADETNPARSGSPTISKLRKNFSSSSLRSLKTRNMSISNLDDASDLSPGTPNNPFGSSRAPAMPLFPTSVAASLRDQMDLNYAGNLHVFEDRIHLPATPGSPNPLALEPPVALESCPSDVMLRPFWLMRCLFQTLVHPRGGYLSTKLFVPREVWKVKNVKLKNVEDKVSNCDLLTAALMKLAKVDTCDADAVLEELQSLEGVLEQVQIALSRKLGSDVGVQSSGVFFKEASNAVEGDGTTVTTRATSLPAKSSSFSWRRLRSKQSSLGLGGAYNSRMSGSDSLKENVSMPTLPMTHQPTSRPPKRDITQAQFIGPNAQYMNSLARLFDAAQAIDQIARQVDDPGLRHADKTQVGLELCTRHAAEFFGFYICRFVLTDLSTLLEKFIKRSSEWVLV